jgi:hypothetical protein
MIHFINSSDHRCDYVYFCASDTTIRRSYDNVIGGMFGLKCEVENARQPADKSLLGAPSIHRT